MSANGQAAPASSNGQVLHWSKRVLCADDLRRSLNGHREIVLPPRAVVTPLAQEQLRHEGIRLRRTESEPAQPPAGRSDWGYAQERPHPLVHSAVTALAREGVSVRELAAAGDDLLCRWARAVAECIAGGQCAGGVLFCQDAGLACCVANKLGGLRAVSVTTVGQAARATLTLGANLLVVEMPGRTFFEVRQIFRALISSRPVCPDGIACTLQELDGHAHR